MWGGGGGFPIAEGTEACKPAADCCPIALAQLDKGTCWLQAGFLSAGKKGSMFSVPDDPSAKVTFFNNPAHQCKHMDVIISTTKKQ